MSSLQAPPTPLDAINNFMLYVGVIASIEAHTSDYCWYVSNVSIIFDALCLFLHHLLSVLLHFMVFLCIFRN
jgi:hypothetical protein